MSFTVILLSLPILSASSLRLSPRASPKIQHSWRSDWRFDVKRADSEAAEIDAQLSEIAGQSSCVSGNCRWRLIVTTKIREFNSSIFQVKIEDEDFSSLQLREYDDGMFELVGSWGLLFCKGNQYGYRPQFSFSAKKEAAFLFIAPASFEKCKISRTCGAEGLAEVRNILNAIEGWLVKAQPDKMFWISGPSTGDSCIDRTMLTTSRNLGDVSVMAMQPVEFHHFVQLVDPLEVRLNEPRCLSEEEGKSCMAFDHIAKPLRRLRGCVVESLKALLQERYIDSTTEDINSHALRFLKVFGWQANQQQNPMKLRTSFILELQKNKNLPLIYGKNAAAHLVNTCLAPSIGVLAKASICLPALYDMPGVTGHGVEEDHMAVVDPQQYIGAISELAIVSQDNLAQEIHTTPFQVCPRMPLDCARWAVAKLSPTFANTEYRFKAFHRSMWWKASWRTCVNTRSSNCMLFGHCFTLALKRVCAEERRCCPDDQMHRKCAQNPATCEICAVQIKALGTAASFAKRWASRARKNLMLGRNASPESVNNLSSESSEDGNATEEYDEDDMDVEALRARFANAG